MRNRQSTRRVKVLLLRRIARTLARELLHKKCFELGISLVDKAEITELNATYMGHQGITDVIALDYCEPKGIAGDIFVCIDEACFQARRFRTTWQSELVRYVVHAVLHLSGHDDRRARDRRRMKEVEDGLVGELAKRFKFAELAQKSQGRRSKAAASSKTEGRNPKSQVERRR